MEISVRDAEKLQLALDVEQNNQSVRLVAPEDIMNRIYEIEGRLSGLMPREDWVDLVFCIDCNAQEFPSSYSGTPMSTQVEVRRLKSGWFVTGIIRWATSQKVIEPLNIDKERYAKAMAEYVSRNF